MPLTLDMPSAALRRLAAGLLVLAALAPAAASADQRIVGGQPASRPYPYAVFVELGFFGGTGYCGGSLVAARYVVTAAHCLSDELGRPPERVDVAIGVTRVDHDRRLADPSNAVPPEHKYLDVAFERHPAFAYGSGDEPLNDVAVLKLPRPAPQAQLRLPRDADARMWSAGISGTAIGWGSTERDLVSPTLLEVQLPFQTDLTCGGPRAYGSAFRAETMLCAGAEASGRDTCQGDSGGPLLAPDAAGDFVLAGVTSWGAGCGQHPAVYARAGSGPLNAWLRQRIPLVEIDASAAEPEPGQEVSLTARPSHPTGGGRFGGYDRLAWDLDADGEFDDAVDQPTVARTFESGVQKVSVRATRTGAEPEGAGDDAEVRTLALPVRHRAPVSFAPAQVTVTEGAPAVVTVVKPGRGSGAVTAVATSGTAGVGVDVLTGQPARLTFGGDPGSHTLTFPTVDDAQVERPETFRVDLSSHSGDLLPGSPGSVTVSIVDNDVAPTATAALGTGRSFTARRGTFRVRVTTSTGGRLRATLTDRSGRTLARSLTRSATTAGRHALTVRLTARGRRALKRTRRVGGTLRVNYQPANGAPTVVLKRAVTLKR